MLPVWYEDGWARDGNGRLQPVGAIRYDQPPELKDLTLAEKMLISRLRPAMSIQHLHHGGIASKGHVATFPRPIEDVAKILPWLPASVDVIRFKRQLEGRQDGSRAYLVRHTKLREALRWLKKHNKFYVDVEIDNEERWRAFCAAQPDESELTSIRVVVTGNPPADEQGDQGPAAHQHAAAVEAGAGDVEWCETAGMMMPTSVPVSIRNELIKLQRGDATASAIHLDWPVSRGTPVNEYSTRGFFSMSFPWLWPSGAGDFFDDRDRGADIQLFQWAEHLLLYEDGRFARDVAWPFIALNMIYRRRARERAQWYVKGGVDDAPLSTEQVGSGVRRCGRRCHA